MGLTCMKRVNTGVLARRASCSCAPMPSAGGHGHMCKVAPEPGCQAGSPEEPQSQLPPLLSREGRGQSAGLGARHSESECHR